MKTSSWMQFYEFKKHTYGFIQIKQISIFQIP